MSTGEYLTGDGLTYDDWREALLDDVLLGQECTGCDYTTGAPKAACPRCGSRELDAVELPLEGEIHSETTIQVPPEGFDRGYQVVVVDVGDARVTGRLDDPGVEIGDEVAFAEGRETENGVAAVFEAA